jgi:hypothetical protein
LVSSIRLIRVIWVIITAIRMITVAEYDKSGAIERV